MKFLILNTNNQLNKLYIEDNSSIKELLNLFYKNINCDTIEIISLKINNITYDLVIDENGKFKSNNIKTLVIVKNSHIMDYIVGNIIFTKSNNNGDTIGLSNYDIINISSWLKNSEKFFINSKLVNIYKI